MSSCSENNGNPPMNRLLWTDVLQAVNIRYLGGLQYDWENQSAVRCLDAVAVQMPKVNVGWETMDWLAAVHEITWLRLQNAIIC